MLKLTKLFLLIGAIVFVAGWIYVVWRGSNFESIMVFEIPLDLLLNPILIGGGLVIIGFAIMYEFSVNKFKR